MNLLRLAASVSGATDALLSELVAELDVSVLDTGSDCPAPSSVSGLNNDGSPLQLCITASRGGAVARLLADPAASEPDEARRFRRARAALRRVAGHTGDGTGVSLSERIEGAFEHALPERALGHGWLTRGSMWIGVAPDRRGLAAYATARWGSPEARWPRALGWLQGVAGAQSVAALGRVSAACQVASLGVEGSVDGVMRAKLYFRLSGRQRLSDLALPPLASPVVERFLEAVLADRAVHPAGLVLSASFDLATHALYDAKVDVCAHCVTRTGPQWARVLAQLADSLGTGSLGVNSDVSRGNVEVAFVGLGLTSAGRTRLNVYLKEPRRRALARGPSLAGAAAVAS